MELEFSPRNGRRARKRGGSRGDGFCSAPHSADRKHRHGFPPTRIPHARGWHPRGAGAHEWWYFDAIDPASGNALVIIFFRGIPFSGQRQKHRDQPADSFPAVAFSLYGPQRTEQYLIRGLGLIRNVEDIRTIVQKQYDGVQRNHDQVRDLRDRYRASAA